MKAYLSKRAAQAAERIDARWREHADAPGTFAQELLGAIDRLEASTGLGVPFPTARHPALRRVLLPRTRCHLYFKIDDAAQVIQILQIWDGRRALPPRL